MSYKKAGGLLSIAIIAGLCSYQYLRKSIQLEFHPAVGSRLDYALDYKAESDTVVDPSQSFIQQFPEHTAVSFKGALALTVVQREGDGYRLNGELRIQESSGLPTSLPPGMSFAMGVTEQGHITDLSFPEDQFASTSFLVIDILKRMDQDLPKAAIRKGDSWAQNESQLDETIRLANVLTEISDDTAGWQKSAAADRFQIAGSERHTWDRSRGILRDVSAERSITQKNLQGLTVRSTLHFQMELQTTAVLSGARIAGILTHYPVQETLKQEQLQKLMQTRQAEKLLGGMSAADLKAAYGDASTTDMRANMELYQKLKALFRLKPESIALFQDLLTELDRNDRRFQMLAAALTAVGNPEAQRALMEAISKSDDEIRRIQLIPHISFVQAPEVSSEDFLRQLAAEDPVEQVRQTAELGLGTMAHQLREAAPERSESIYRSYASELQAAQKPSEMEHQLQIIGNIGLPDQLNTVKPFLDHDDPQVRSSAYSSLRYVEAPKAREILLQGVAKDKSEIVREHAAEGLTYAIPDSQVVAGIEAILETEKNITIIKNLLRVLARDAVTNRASRDYIQTYLQNCAHPDLCSFVSGMLSSLTEKGG